MCFRNDLICDSSLKFVLGYGLGGFSVVWDVLGCFNGPRKNKSYACVPNLAGNQMRQNYNGLLVKVLNVRR